MDRGEFLYFRFPNSGFHQFTHLLTGMRSSQSSPVFFVKVSGVFITSRRKPVGVSCFSKIRQIAHFSILRPPAEAVHSAVAAGIGRASHSQQFCEMFHSDLVSFLAVPAWRAVPWLLWEAGRAGFGLTVPVHPRRGSFLCRLFGGRGRRLVSADVIQQAVGTRAHLSCARRSRTWA
jgi:hypothetical protein